MKYSKMVLFILLFILAAPIHEGFHVLVANHIYHANNISVSYPFFGLNPEYPVQKYMACTSYEPTTIEKNINIFFEEIIAYSIQLFVVLVMYTDITGCDTVKAGRSHTMHPPGKRTHERK